MKKLSILFLSLIFLISCKELDQFTQFTVIYHTEATIPATIPMDVPFDIPTPAITTNSSQTFENNNTHKDLIEEIHLTKVKLKITDPVNGDFSFLSDIEIFISSENLPEKKIAWLYDIPNNVNNELNLNTTQEDLQAYIKADSFSLRVKVTTDEIITRDYQIDIQTEFLVNAKILGI